jgi:hypothetical protein
MCRGTRRRCDPPPPQLQAKIRAATLRWHPDKFSTVYQPLCAASAWPAVSDMAVKLSQAALILRRE